MSVLATNDSLRSEDVTKYSHLGIVVQHGRLQLPEPTIPNPALGRYSRANVEGYLSLFFVVGVKNKAGQILEKTWYKNGQILS